VDVTAGLHYSFALSAGGLATSYASAGSTNSAAFPFPDGPITATIYSRIFDKDGGYSDYHTPVTVNNVAPTAGLSGPSAGVRGQTQTFTLGATDPSPVDQAAGFTFMIAWGDGASQTLTALSGLTLSHVYGSNGGYTVSLSATDKDGA